MTTETKIKLPQCPEYFDEYEMGNFYDDLRRNLEFPERPEKPDRKHYKTHAEYGAALDEYEGARTSKYREAQKEYQRQANEVEAAFKTELLKRLGIAKHPKAGLLFEMAYEDGHSEGYRQVASIASTLAELLK